VQNDLKHAISIMKNKQLTDTQLVYIFNTVLIPRIEYKTQLTFLSESSCHSLLGSYITLIKKKLHLSNKTPKSLFTSNMFYNLTSVYQRLLQQHCSALLHMVNEKNVLGDSFKFRLNQLQSSEWLFKSPLVYWPFTQHKRQDDWLPSLLCDLQSLNIVLSTPDDMENRIRGGSTPISSILSSTYRSFSHELRSRSLLFMEQVVNSNGNYLFTYDDFKQFLSPSSKAVKIPAWFRSLESTLQVDTSRFLPAGTSFPHNIWYGYHTELPFHTTTRASYVVGWYPNINNFVIGKITLIEESSIHMLHLVPRMDHQHKTLLEECNGCSLNDNSIHRMARHWNRNCGIQLPFNFCANIYVRKQQSNSSLYCTWSMGALHELAMSCFIRHSFPSSNLPSLPYILQNFNNLIEKFVLPPHIDSLLTFSTSFSNSICLDFYTDGSLVNLGSPSIRMGLAWLQTHPDSPMVSFSSACSSSFPSSSLPEFMAIFSAILTAPRDCAVTIYTDSSVVMTQYNSFKNISSRSPTCRPLLKINNFMYWACFFEVVSQMNLHLKLIKVKAHSRDVFNDKVDALAKSCLDSTAFQLNLHQSPLVL
jgi:ribonuclease HI